MTCIHMGGALFRGGGQAGWCSLTLWSCVTVFLPLALTPSPPPHSQASSSSSFIFTFDLSLSRFLGQEPLAVTASMTSPSDVLLRFVVVPVGLSESPPACGHHEAGTTSISLAFPGPHSYPAHNRYSKNRSLWGKKAIMNSLAKICGI